MQVYEHKFRLKFVNSKLVLSCSTEAGTTVNFAKIISRRITSSKGFPQQEKLGPF